MRRYYDLCPKCNSELRGRSGAVMDSYPAIYPVKCTSEKCDYEGSSHLMSETIDMKWPMPQDLRESK